MKPQDKLSVRKSRSQGNEFTISVRVSNDVDSGFTGSLTFKNKYSDKETIIPVYYSQRRISKQEFSEPRFDQAETPSRGQSSFLTSLLFYAVVGYILYTYGPKIVNDVQSYLYYTVETMQNQRQNINHSRNSNSFRSALDEPQIRP